MIAVLMLRAIAISVLLAIAGVAVQRVCAWYGVARRWVWVAVMLASMILAFVQPKVDALSQRAAPTPTAPRAVSHASPSAVVSVVQAGADAIQHVRTSDTRSVLDAAPYIWAALSLTMLAAIGAAYLRMRHVRRGASRAEIDGVSVHVTDRDGPAVIGFVHPSVVVPRWVLDTPALEQRSIVAHEQSHVDAGDHWLLAFGAIAVAVMPWNLALWWQRLRLSSAIETDCDARVIARGVERRAYCETLIRYASAVHADTLMAPALRMRAAQLRERIDAMTSSPPSARAARAVLFVSFAALVVLVACEAATSVSAARPVSLPSVMTADTGNYWPAEGFFGFHDSSRVRVSGFTREREIAQLTITDGGGRIVPLPGTSGVRFMGDTVAIFTTPGEFRIEGTSAYRLVADAMGSGMEVKIEGTAPSAKRVGHAASARGVAPMLSFLAPNDPRGAVTPVRVEYVLKFPRDTYKMKMELDPNAQIANSSQLEPGHVLVETQDGTPQLVRVDATSEIQIIAKETRRTERSTTVEAMTPFEVVLTPFENTLVRFEPTVASVMLTADAAGGAGFGFERLGGRYGALLICASAAEGGGIGGAKRGEKLSALRCP